MTKMLERIDVGGQIAPHLVGPRAIAREGRFDIPVRAVRIDEAGAV